jgi:hypothetical protein
VRRGWWVGTGKEFGIRSAGWQADELLKPEVVLFSALAMTFIMPVLHVLPLLMPTNLSGSSLSLPVRPDDNDRLVASFSGGWQMRMCLGKLLLQVKQRVSLAG